MIYRFLEKVVREILRDSRETGKHSGLFIGGTRKLHGEEISLGPPRTSASCVAGSVIVSSLELALEIAQWADGIVDYIFVDAEYKYRDERPAPENFSSEIAFRQVILSSRLLTFKGNDLAAASIDLLISTLLSHGQFTHDVSTKVGIIGAGNIGSKVALGLIERGINVSLFRRNPEALDAIVSGVNRIKSGISVATASVAVSALDCANGANLLIGLSNGSPSVTSKLVESCSEGALFIDGGTGTFSGGAIKAIRLRGASFFRASVQLVIAGAIESIISADRQLASGKERAYLHGITLVGNGIFAERGELVVDNACNPTMVLGVADGKGGLLPKPIGAELRRLEKISQLLQGT